MAERSEDPTVKLEQELRRGVIVLAALSQLRTAQYGYSLRQALAERGMPIEEGTLYPLLRRLEAQGLLASEWRIEDGPPRRYYTLNGEGKKLYAELTASWRSLVATLDALIGEDQAPKEEEGSPMTAAADPEVLIEGYVEEIIRRLPRRLRSDVGFELRALLFEQLRDCSLEAGRPADEAMSLDLIETFGRPDDVAGRYGPQDAMIIPAAQARGFFWASIVGVALQWTFSLPAALAGGPQRIGAWWITSGLGALWWPGFLVTIAMIAALIRQRWPAEEWQARSIDRDRINRPLYALGVAAALAGVAVWVAIAWVEARAAASGPAAAAFAFAGNFLFVQGPVVLAYWTASITLLVVVLIEGRWRNLTRRLSFAMHVAALALMLWLIFGGPIFLATPSDSTAKAGIGLVVLLILAGLAIKLWRSQGRIRRPQTLSPPAA